MPAVKPRSQQVIKKIYIQQPNKGEFYGAPKLALYIIVVNMLFWLVLANLLYLQGGGSLQRVPLLFVGLSGFLFFQLLIQFVLWKLYWWAVGCGWIFATFLLLTAFIAIASGSLPALRLSF
jgi:hypothetical protein